MTEDSRKLDRTAQFLSVYYIPCGGPSEEPMRSVPYYSPYWKPVWDVKVDRIEINAGTKPSIAVLWFPEKRWQNNPGLKPGDAVKICNERNIMLFSGTVTSGFREFSGGSDKSSGYERNAVICKDYHWMYGATSLVYGQYARGPDDYENYGTEDQVPIPDRATFLSGRRTIFNENGRPNRDPVKVTFEDRGITAEIPVFADTGAGEYWTAKEMLSYIMCYAYNRIYAIYQLVDPSKQLGLEHDDWNKVLHHIVVDGLSNIEAMDLICKHLGWGFRLDYTEFAGYFTFYKFGAASYGKRSSNAITIAHTLYAPKVGENIKKLVAAGKKLLWVMTLQNDISDIINVPLLLGSPHRFEITAELVPAWSDSDLVPDTEELCFTEAEIQEMDDPESKDYYKYYHSSGSGFKHEVGRKWALNEAGDYCGGSYDRGLSFDFAKVIPEKYIKTKKTENSPAKRMYAPYRRQLLPCLTLDKKKINSIGIRVEFSFDGGTTWQIIPARISSLTDEAGIYIDEENLAEMVDKENGTISGGELDGKVLNLWTSLCDDKINGRVFKDKDSEEPEVNPWKTRVRVTASIQLDLRPGYIGYWNVNCGSPIKQAAIYDFSNKYGLAERTESSIFHGGSLEAIKIDNIKEFTEHGESIQDANDEMSVSGRFVLERLWIDEDNGQPVFMIGDCIEKIAGRNFNLNACYSIANPVYSEIVKIVYLPEQQHTVLLTRNIKFTDHTIF